MLPLFRTVKPFAWFAAISLAIVISSRISLMLWQSERLSLEAALQVMLSGLRVDVMTLCMILILPALMLVILPVRVLHSRPVRAGLTTWLLAWLIILVFMEVVTPFYMEFFSTRPGRIFFEYLNRPGEVAGLIGGAYKLAAVLSLAVPVFAARFAWRRLQAGKDVAGWRWPHRLIMVLVVLALALGGRGSTGHRPANPSTFAFSGDQLVNDLILNSTYKLLYALYSLRHEQDPGTIYPDMSAAEILATVKEDTGTPADRFIDAGSTQHRFGNGTEPAKKKHILVIVEESLGARFVGSLGGLPLTPRLDEFSKQGIWFNRLYATGIRSARGLEAIVAGFPPSPARSVLKLSGSQTGFFTMASLLGSVGYSSHFIYGGEAHFDNMQGFFLNNGFDVAVDINDYDEYLFKGTWGVSDEDLFNRTHQVLLEADAPVFAVAFTSSFHSPYDFPEDRIELYETPKATKNNAVKYADFALGQFLDRATQSAYWQDTLILIVADHDERPRGYDLVPVSSYHIPGLILGGDILPGQIDRITSQIDLLPTLLQLAGISGTAPFVGRDVLAAPPDAPGRAIMQYHDNHAYLLGDQIVIHRPDLPALQLRYDVGEDNMTAVPMDQALEKKALAWALLPGLLYRDKLYSPFVDNRE